MAIVPRVKSRGVDYDPFEESGLGTSQSVIKSTERAEAAEPYRDFLGNFSSDRLLGSLMGLGSSTLGTGAKGIGYGLDFLNFPNAGASMSDIGSDFYDDAGSYFSKGLLGGLKNELGLSPKEDEIIKISQEFNLRPEFVKAQLERDRKTNIEKIKKMPEESSIFEEDVDMSLMGSIAKAAEQAKQDEKTNLDAFPKLNADEAIRAENEAKRLETIAQDKAEAEAGYEDGGEDAYEKLQNSAIEDIAKSQGETVTPATREELLAKYKKEFYEATGLDPSGKADKSSALMAMGLALMQNKAGKGFNVGRMLSAVGEAGEKALPKLEAAKKTAKAEALAAGKYALGRIQAGESAAAALAKEARTLKQAKDLKLLELRIDAQNDEKAGMEIKGIKNTEFFNGFNINMGRNKEGEKFAFPRNALNKTEAAMKRINGALKKTDEIDILLSQYDGNKFGGTAGEIALNRAKAMANRFGAKFEFKDGSKLDPRLQIESLGNAIIAEYKKMLTQEAGNGISNVDVERLVALLGKPGELLTIEQLQKNVGSIREIFMSKKQEIDSVADDLQDPNYYALESEWENNKQRAMNLKRINYTLVDGDILTTVVPRISVKD